MALVDPYAPCPCGSGKKFKWCCHKVESYAERAQRLVDNGQYDAAISVLSEGLAKVPDNPWLLLRKAMIFLMQQKPEEAKQAVATLLRKQPDHLGAAVLQTRLLLGTDGPVAAAAQLQRALNHINDDARPGLSRLAAIVARRDEQGAALSRGVQAFRTRPGDRIGGGRDDQVVAPARSRRIRRSPRG